MPLDPPTAGPPMPPPVHAAVAMPAQQLDVGAALAPKPGIRPVVDRRRRRAPAVQHQRPATVRAQPVARHKPPPAPSPPDRRAHVQPVQRRVTTPTAHQPPKLGTILEQSAPFEAPASVSVSRPNDSHRKHGCFHTASIGPPCLLKLAAANIKNSPLCRAFVRWAIQDSNLGPLPYQRSALTD
jgi:hypothetical protein